MSLLVYRYEQEHAHDRRSGCSIRVARETTGSVTGRVDPVVFGQAELDGNGMHRDRCGIVPHPIQGTVAAQCERGAVVTV